MKPIGIGQLKKVTPKGGQPDMTRHEMPTPPPTMGTALTDEQEGQLSVDVYQTEREIIIVAPVAGSAAEDINVSITEDVVTIKGRRELTLKDELTDEDSYIQECFWGNFSRSIVLPAEVDTNNVKAHFKHNILTVRIPKTERVRTRIVKIQHD